MALTQKQREELRNKFVGRPAQQTGSERMQRLRALVPQEAPQQATQMTEQLQESFGEKVSGFFKGFGKGILETAKESGELVQRIGERVPEPAKRVLGVLNPAENIAARTVTQVPGAISQVEERTGLEPGELTTPQTGAERAGMFAETAAEFLIPTGAGAKAGSAALKASRASKFKDRLIGPLTKKDLRQAFSEGRVIQRTGFAKRLGLADEVVADQKVKDAAQTLLSRNEKVVKMTDQEIANFAQKEIDSIAKEVAPRLREIAVPEKLKADAVDSWIDLKRIQSENVVANSGQVRRLHDKFEKVFLDALEADNADDVWKYVQEFDRTVPRTVKQATRQSAETTQELKSMWLDQRRILRDVLDEAVSAADDTVKKEFADMSNLYTARENIINAARFEKGRSSFGKQLLGGTIGAALGGTALGRLFID